MNKFDDNYVKFDENNTKHKQLLEQLDNYNFVQNKDYESLIKHLKADPKSINFNGLYVYNKNLYVKYSYFDWKFNGIGTIIGQFDCYTKTVGHSYEWDESLTKIWRKIMIKAYGLPYKQELKEILEQRRTKFIFDINANINAQIRDIEDDINLLN